MSVGTLMAIIVIIGIGIIVSLMLVVVGLILTIRKKDRQISEYQSRLITDETIAQVESVLGFTLLSWQKRFLQGDWLSFPRSGRQNGKTLAYCLYLLLNPNCGSFSVRDRRLIEELSDTSLGRTYDRWFSKHILGLNEELTNAGIKTNIQIEERGDAE